MKLENITPDIMPLDDTPPSNDTVEMDKYDLSVQYKNDGNFDNQFFKIVDLNDKDKLWEYYHDSDIFWSVHINTRNTELLNGFFRIRFPSSLRKIIRKNILYETIENKLFEDTKDFELWFTFWIREQIENWLKNAGYFEKVNPDSIDQTIMKIFNSNVAWKYRFMVFSYTILAKHQT
ncbi:MAG: hypothetical protein LBP59_01575, partial [Planctomycetaceae bacterium]|nr:hypothetical protein [Planctomycetaceae bacterium]